VLESCLDRGRGFSRVGYLGRCEGGGDEDRGGDEGESHDGGGFVWMLGIFKLNET
jgi:hypothetical protein